MKSILANTICAALLIEFAVNSVPTGGKLIGGEQELKNENQDEENRRFGYFMDTDQQVESQLGQGGRLSRTGQNNLADNRKQEIEDVPINNPQEETSLNHACSSEPPKESDRRTPRVQMNLIGGVSMPNTLQSLLNEMTKQVSAVAHRFNLYRAEDGSGASLSNLVRPVARTRQSRGGSDNTCLTCTDCTGCTNSNTMVNCQNCNGCDTCTNCSGCSDCHTCVGCQGCNGSYTCTGCKNCTGCKTCVSCDDCTDCDTCTGSKGCKGCNTCTGCTNCTNCVRCTNCHNCNGLVGVNGQTC